MTIDEAIKHCREKANCSECGKQHEQLMGWLTDLKKRKNNNLVYICSPYRGDIERNMEYARELTRIALDCGYAPITPHLYLTQVLNEEDPEQRKRGMAAGEELLKNCKYIFIGSRYGISEGMLSEIQIALEADIIELAQEKGGLVEVYGGQQA